jgi:HD-GYP domain-containing protein (c-di-GMP phosphodiesterase class II)
MDTATLRRQLTEYVNNITEIRRLSGLHTDGAPDADTYCRRLHGDYQRIGELGVRCREILDATVYPIASNSDAIESDVLAVLQEFCMMLLEPESGEELDLSLLFELSDRLLSEFRQKGDEDGYITQAYIHVNVCYANVNRTARITVSRETTENYRDEGLHAAQIVRGYIRDHDKFLRLGMQARNRALMTARRCTALYDTFFAENDTNHIHYQAIVDAVRLYDDAFYRDNTEGYNWDEHRYASIEQLGGLTERGNRWGFYWVQCEAICAWLSVLEKHTDPEGTPANFRPYLRLLVLRNSYYAGRIEKPEYQDSLLALYREVTQRTVSDEDNAYDLYSVRMNLLLPAEYLSTLPDVHLSARTVPVLREIYDNVIRYMLHSVDRDAFGCLQEYLSAFLEMFIELPGEMTFETMGLYCMAALHPPTYVHSLQVADISKCLADHLLAANPAVFVEEFGYDSVEAVANDRLRVLDFIYHSALCHDFGKIAMFDSIFIYGRNLLDSEYNIIRKHTVMGEKMLRRFPSTARYADIVKNHHVWYDGKGGYPAGSVAQFPVCVNIIETADSIDAATDSIGRSYRNAKTLEDVLREVAAASGTRYAPYIAALFESGEVREDMEYILGEGRQENYRRTFSLLTGKAPVSFK